MKKQSNNITTLTIGLLIFLFLLSIRTVQALPIIPKKQRIIIENLMKGGAYNDALNSIRELTPLYPENAELLMLTGVCYSNIPAYNDLTIKTFQSALNANPDDNLKIEILYNLANAQMEIQHYADAISNYTLLKNVIPATFKEFHQQIDTKIASCTAFLNNHNTTNPKTANNILDTTSSSAQNPPPTVTQMATDSTKIPIAQNVSVLPPRTTNAVTSDSQHIVYKKITTSTPNISSLINPTTKTEQTLEKGVNFPIIDYIYTIQICALKYPASKNHFKEKNSIRILKEGNIYKYFYSRYGTIDEARGALPTVQTLYPGAYITRYSKKDEGKLLRISN